PSRVHTLRTGNDDSVANLNIRDRNSWQSVEHVVDIESGSSTTRTAGPGCATLRPRRRCTLRLLTAASRRSAATGSARSASKATHCSHLRRKLAQHSIMLDDDRERMFLFQFVDLDLAGCRINCGNYTADRAETSGHDFLRFEVQRIFRAITERA